jgi:ribosomal protein L24E
MKRAFDLYPHKCRNCGKKFEAGSEYVYRTETRGDHFMWFCSWKCLQEWKRKKEVKKGAIENE